MKKKLSAFSRQLSALKEETIVISLWLMTVS